MKVNSVDFCSKRNTYRTAGPAGTSPYFFTCSCAVGQSMGSALPRLRRRPKITRRPAKVALGRLLFWDRFCQDPKT